MNAILLTDVDKVTYCFMKAKICIVIIDTIRKTTT